MSKCAHLWQPFPSDPRYARCKTCGEAARLTLTHDDDPMKAQALVSPNPCVQRWGAGPEGATCKTCVHLRAIRMAGTYWKCELREDLTHGSKTDQRVSWPACAKHKKGEE